MPGYWRPPRAFGPKLCRGFWPGQRGYDNSTLYTQRPYGLQPLMRQLLLMYIAALVRRNFKPLTLLYPDFQPGQIVAVGLLSCTKSVTNPAIVGCVVATGTIEAVTQRMVNSGLAVPEPASADGLKRGCGRAADKTFQGRVSFRKTLVLPQTQRR